MSDHPKKKIKVVVIPGGAPQQIEYVEGATVGSILETARIKMTDQQEVRLDADKVTPETKVTGDHISLTVGKNTAGNRN